MNHMHGSEYIAYPVSVPSRLPKWASLRVLNDPDGIRGEWSNGKATRLYTYTSCARREEGGASVDSLT